MAERKRLTLEFDADFRQQLDDLAEYWQLDTGYPD